MENTGISDQHRALGEPCGMAGVLPAVLRYGKSLRRGSDGAVGAGGQTGICHRTVIHGGRHDCTQDLRGTGVLR